MKKSLHRLSYFLFFSLLLNFQVEAQQSPYTISGKIVDATTHEALPFASVLVVQKKSNGDSSKIGGNSDDKGEFVLKNIRGGNAKVQISFVGYQNIEKVIKIANNTNLGTISLQPSSSLLQAVEVKAQKNTADLTLEKKVFNVSDAITTIGGTAENLLRNIPSLSIEPDGTALLRNSTATIYVDGKPTQLTLAQIPANQIESVEVISNPSAKYEAAATGGIVNLVLKKNRIAGYNGTVSVGIGQNHRYDGMLNLELNTGKWNVSLMYNINSKQNPTNGYSYRTNFDANRKPTSFYNQNTDVVFDNVFQNGRLAIDYNLDKQNTITLAGNYVSGKFNNASNQSYDYQDANHTITNYGVRVISPQNTYNNQGIELDWKHSFRKKGEKISFTSVYNHNNSSNAADWLTTSLNADGSSQAEYPEKDIISGNSVGDQVVLQLDYTKPVNDSTKWEYGLRSLTFIRDQQYFFNQLLGNETNYQLLVDYSQNARITERVNAAYALYSTKLKNNFSLQAGLRMELSSLTGVSRFEPYTTFGYDYPSSSGKNLIKAFFPSFAISKKLGKESEIGFNLSRKIGRPGWRQMFVGILASDRQNIMIGNPEIQPEFVNTAELNYNKSFGKTNWLSSLYYIYEDNTIKPVTQPSATDPTVLVTTFTNAKADIQGGWDNTLTFYVVKDLSILANLNFFRYTLSSDAVTKSQWSARSKMNITYKFPWNITAQISGNYSSRRPTLQGYREQAYTADFALRKSFWKNKGSIAFTVNDIFNSSKYVNVYDQPMMYQESMFRRDMRYYKFTLQLPLNRNAKTDTKKRRPTNGGDSQEMDFGGG